MLTKSKTNSCYLTCTNHLRGSVQTPSAHKLYAFDAHNHVHLSLDGGIPALSKDEIMLSSGADQILCQSEEIDHLPSMVCEPNELNIHAKNILHAIMLGDEGKEETGKSEFQLSGIALMSTQPRDFPVVKKLSDHILRESQEHSDEKKESVDSVIRIVRNYGVHPWFLREAQLDFSGINNSDPAFILNKSLNPPWLPFLKLKLESDPNAHIGEIGLDGARYEIDPDSNERILVSNMESQLEAFEAQMHLAADMDRSVSIHAVQCWGPLMDSLRGLKEMRSKWKKDRKADRKELKRKLELCKDKGGPNYDALLERWKKMDEDVLVFPRNIYFHAFGGKAAIVDQLDAICRNKNFAPGSSSEIFFGFAPVVNFKSHKTPSVIQKVGIHRLVLETDVEDCSRLCLDLESSVEYIAKALNMEKEEVLKQTSDNARRLYRLH